MDFSSLMLSMLYGSIGLGMFMYGRNAGRLVPLGAGVLLMIIPFFVTAPLWMSIACVLCMASPFLISGD